MGNLASVLDELLALDPRDVPGPELGSEITEGRRQANRADGLYLKQLVVLDGSGAAQADYGSTQAWAKAELRLTPARASRDVHLARDLSDGLPLTFAALCDGSISIEHAQVIASIRGIVSDEYLAACEPHLVDAATWKTPQQLRKVTAHVVHSHRPDKAARNEEDDYAARSLHASTTIGGTLVPRRLAPSPRFASAWTHAAVVAAPTTTRDQTRLLGLNRSTQTDQASSGPNASQRPGRQVRAQATRWAGCDAPPAWCDAHHGLHWSHGGPTNVDNGALLCGRHHAWVHAHGHAIIKTQSGPYKVDLRPRSDPNWQGHPKPHRRT
jgi:hypothetical protein